MAGRNRCSMVRSSFRSTSRSVCWAITVLLAAIVIAIAVIRKITLAGRATKGPHRSLPASVELRDGSTSALPTGKGASGTFFGIGTANLCIRRRGKGYGQHDGEKCDYSLLEHTHIS